MINKLRKYEYRKLYPLMLFILIPIINIAYTVLNNDNNGQISSLITDFDLKIPFIAGFAIPYIIWYPFIIFGFIYVLIKDKNIYYKATYSYIVSLIVCYIIYFFFQTTVPRPVVTGDDFFSKLVILIYNQDNPYNCFPSIHVLSTYILVKALFKCKKVPKLIKLTSFVLGVLIILSTVFIKQHVLMDIFMGIILGDISFKGISNLSDILINNIMYKNIEGNEI